MHQIQCIKGGWDGHHLLVKEICFAIAIFEKGHVELPLPLSANCNPFKEGGMATICLLKGYGLPLLSLRKT